MFYFFLFIQIKLSNNFLFRLDLVDPVKNTAIISFKGSTLELSLSLVDIFDARINDIIQVIGDLKDGVLVVRSFKVVNDLNLTLFESALYQREKFLRYFFKGISFKVFLLRYFF